MTYAQGRIYHDADAHVFEDPEFYLPYADAATRAKMAASCLVGLTGAQFAGALGAQAEAGFHDKADAEVMTRKLWRAMGAYRKQDRPRALDLMGFSSQLVFDSFMRFTLREAEEQPVKDLDFIYNLARAHNRAMVDFCSVDRRLMAVGYVPMIDIGHSIVLAREAIDMGCAALQTSAGCNGEQSPSHIGFDPMWDLMAQAGVPLVYHLGAGRLPSDVFTRNGLPGEPAFHGGDGRLQAHDYVATPHPVIETITTLIMDGVLQRHPKLRLGLVEFGGCWLPGWLRFLDSAMDAFRRTETRLQTLDLKLSEYVTRQVRCTIFPHEDLGWSIAQSSPDIFMFSSDYPHIEGGRDPIARFEASMDRQAIPAAARERFYRTNFEDFVGGNVPQLISPVLDGVLHETRP